MPIEEIITPLCEVERTRMQPQWLVKTGSRRSNANRRKGHTSAFRTLVFKGMSYLSSLARLIVRAVTNVSLFSLNLPPLEFISRSTHKLLASCSPT